MNDEKIWYESINDLPIEKDKVKNFHYPINPGETIQFRESLANNLVNLFRELKINQKQNRSQNYIKLEKYLKTVNKSISQKKLQFNWSF